jgi:hypothetical protein
MVEILRMCTFYIGNPDTTMCQTTQIIAMKVFK